MVLRYWLVDGKATTVEDVDRLVFISLLDFSYRRFVVDRYDWCKLKYGVDFLQFTLVEK